MSSLLLLYYANSTQVRLPNDVIKIRLTLRINLCPKCSIKTSWWVSLDRFLPISQVPPTHISSSPVRPSFFNSCFWYSKSTAPCCIILQNNVLGRVLLSPSNSEAGQAELRVLCPTQGHVFSATLSPWTSKCSSDHIKKTCTIPLPYSKTLTTDNKKPPKSNKTM